MNIVEQQNRVLYHMDRQKSARFASSILDAAINVATWVKFNEGAADFQQNQNIRDYMSPLVVYQFPITPVNGNQLIYPDNYAHEVALAGVFDGKKSSIRSASYNEINNLEWNAFTRVNGDKPGIEQFYKIEGSGKHTVTWSGTTFSVAYLDYMRQMIPVFRSTTPISAGPLVLTIGETYYVNSGTVTHNSITYTVGSVFTAITTVLTGTGNVIVVHNCELGITVHEEICKLAAADLSANIENWLKMQAKGTEMNSN